MNPIWFLRMAKWARHPPSASRVILVLSVIGISIVLFGIDYFFGWPEWLTPDRVPKGRIKF
jgi:hypothetical protein